MSAGLECSRQVGPHVEVAGAWPTAQPLDRSADGEVGAERLEISSGTVPAA